MPPFLGLNLPWPNYFFMFSAAPPGRRRKSDRLPGRQLTVASIAGRPGGRPYGARILFSNHSRWGFFNQFGEFSTLAKFVGGSQEVASLFDSAARYTRSIMNVSRARFTHSRQNGTLAESRSEEGSLTGSSAQPDTWRIPHSSPPFQPGTHTDRAITARGEGPRPAVFRSICCVSVQGRDGRGWGGGDLSKDSLPIESELRLKNEHLAHHGTTSLTTDVNVC